MFFAKRYDVFLFYYRSDKEAVKSLAQRLSQTGLKPFFEQWPPTPDKPWQEKMENALNASQSVAVFLGPRGGGWENKEMNAMLNRHVKNRNLPLIPVLLPGATKPKGGQWVELRENNDDQAFEVLVNRIRNVLTQQLIEKLKTTRFVTVLGPLKTLQVLDEFLAALQQGALPDSKNWPVLRFTPTAQPLEELAAQLSDWVSERRYGYTSYLGRLLRELEADERQLHLSVRLTLKSKKAPATRRLVLVVEQFEELFTLCKDEKSRQQFLANLLYASGLSGGRVVVILTMQDDFVAHSAEYPEIAKHLSTSLFCVTPMKSAAFKKIVTLLEQGFLKVDSNPYIVGPRLDPDAGTPFVGRQDLIDWIGISLQGRQKPLLVLHGQKRMGKTSLLQQVEKGKQGKRLREELEHAIYPVYIDLQDLIDRKTELFLIDIAEAIAKTVRHRALTCPDPIEEAFSDDPYAAFHLFLDTVESRLDNGLLLLMLDEFEELEERVKPCEKNKQCLKFVSQLQHRDSIAFLLAGSHRLEEMFPDYQSMIFKEVLDQEISWLKRSEAMTLIREPVRPTVRYDDEAVEKIWLVTRGHPYFIQLLCWQIIDQMNERAISNRISQMYVEQAIERIIERGGQQLSYLWDGQRPIEQAVLAAMAELLDAEHAYTTSGQIVEHLSRANRSFSEPDISKALDRLVAHRMIEKSDSEPATEVAYSYYFDLLRRWLSRKYPRHTLLFQLKEG